MPHRSFWHFLTFRFHLLVIQLIIWTVKIQPDKCIKVRKK